MQWQQKLNQLNKLQKTHQVQYIIIKSLYQAYQQSPQITKNYAFKSLYYNVTQVMRKLHLYKKLSHMIWQNQDLPIQIREKCSTLSIVSQWIVNFQMKMADLKSIRSQFAMIRQFMITYCKSYQDKVILINQIYQDLKQMLQQRFWSDFNYEAIKNQEQSQITEASSEDAQQIISLLQLLVQREMLSIPNKQKSQFILQASQFYNNKYYEFVLRCLFYLLSIKMNNCLQISTTKLSLLFIQSSFALKNQKSIINLLKRLMTGTKKVVRFAAMGQYIQIYEFLQRHKADQTLQQIQDMVYFRELIIGQTKYQQIQVVKQAQLYPIQVFTSLYVKAGARQRLYFSNEQDKVQILKLQILIDGNVDITLRICHINKNKEESYYLQEKTSSRELQILLKYKGLYALEFDNVYSWVMGKKIKYKFSIYKQHKIGKQN